MIYPVIKSSKIICLSALDLTTERMRITLDKFCDFALHFNFYLVLSENKALNISGATERNFKR